MSKETIWEQLKKRGFSDVAAAAIMGNMEAESNCISCRLQGDFSNGFQRSKEYTAQVNSGLVSKYDFTNNGPGGGGYGLCQWTYPSRKEGLYNLTVAQGISIDDEAMQIEWFMRELNQGEFGSVLNTLQSAETIRECSDAIVKNYLRPYDQSEAACIQRANFGKEIYSEFVYSDPADEGSASGICVSEDQYKIMTAAMNVIAILKDIINTISEFDL